MKKLFATVAFAAAAMSVSAQPEGITPHTPLVPWGNVAETIVTSDLVSNATGKWLLTDEAKTWIAYERDGSVSSANEVQQTNRTQLFHDIYDETTDTMIVWNNDWSNPNYKNYLSKSGVANGLLIAGESYGTRCPHFYVTKTTKVKVYYYGSGGKASNTGTPQLNIVDLANPTDTVVITSDKVLYKGLMESVMLSYELDQSKSYEIIPKSAGKGQDLAITAVKFYGDALPITESKTIMSGIELGGYIKAYWEQFPDATEFELEGNGKYTIASSITPKGSFSLTGVAAAPATIDASALSKAFIDLKGDTLVHALNVDSTVNANYLYIKDVKVANLTIDGLQKALVQDNVKILVENITVDNAVIKQAGGGANIFNFNGKGYPANILVKNSTLYSDTANVHKGYFLQSGGRVRDLDGNQATFKQTITIENSTLSNIAVTKQANNMNGKGQKSLYLTLKNNILNNFGTAAGNEIRGWLGGQNSNNPTVVYENNTYVAADSICPAWTDATKQGADTTNTQLTTIPFKNGTSNFTVAANSQQAKFRTGDPRWLVAYATDAIKLEVDKSENTDFAKVLNEKLQESEQPSSITVTFFEAGEYPLTEEISTTAPIKFVNAGDIDAGDATIVASTAGMKLGGTRIEFDGVNVKANDLAVPFITLLSNPYAQTVHGTKTLSDITKLCFNNLSITGLNKALVKGNGAGNYIKEVEVKNSVIQLEKGAPVTFDFSGANGGVTEQFNVVKSTVWAPEATSTSFYSGQSSINAYKEAGIAEQIFNFTESTLYNLTKGKNFITHRANSQTWITYYLRNSLVLDCGKQGQFIKSINGGGSSKNPKWNVSGNAIFFTVEGAITDQSAAESTGDADEPATNFISGAMGFNDLANGNFGGKFQLAAGVAIPSTLGDPRWTIEYIETIPAGDVTYALAEGDAFTSGQVVEVKIEDDVVATIQYGEAGEWDGESAHAYAPFNAAATDANASAWGYTASTGGNGVNGNKAGGTFYTITPKYDGVVAAAIILNADKKFHLVVDGEQNPTFDNNTVTAKYYGPVEFNVAGGKTYKFFCDGSKLGFYGFNYKFGPDVEPIVEKSVEEQRLIATGINLVVAPATESSVIYDLRGQQVEGALKSGIYIRDGKKFVVK